MARRDDGGADETTPEIEAQASGGGCASPRARNPLSPFAIRVLTPRQPRADEEVKLHELHRRTGTIELTLPGDPPARRRVAASDWPAGAGGVDGPWIVSRARLERDTYGRIRGCSRAAAHPVRGRVATVAEATGSSNGERAADTRHDPARARRRAGPVRRAGCNDLDLVRPAPGPRGVANCLRPAVPDAGRHGPGDEARLVRAGRRQRHDHLPGRCRR